MRLLVDVIDCNAYVLRRVNEKDGVLSTCSQFKSYLISLDFKINPTWAQNAFSLIQYNIYSVNSKSSIEIYFNLVRQI